MKDILPAKDLLQCPPKILCSWDSAKPEVTREKKAC